MGDELAHAEIKLGDPEVKSGTSANARVKQ